MVARSIKFVLLYHLVFFATTLIVVGFIEGFGAELFGYAVWFNIYYLVIGGIMNFLVTRITWSYLKSSRTLILCITSLLFILVLNMFAYYPDRVLLIKNIFSANAEDFALSLAAHSCLTISFIITCLIMRNQFLRL